MGFPRSGNLEVGAYGCGAARTIPTGTEYSDLQDRRAGSQKGKARNTHTNGSFVYIASLRYYGSTHRCWRPNPLPPFSHENRGCSAERGHMSNEPASM